MDVRPEIQNVCNQSVVVAKATDVFYEVYRQMDEHKLRAIPIVDDDGRLTGLVTLLDLLLLVKMYLRSSNAVNFPKEN